jgi:hypothetical protein
MERDSAICVWWKNQRDRGAALWAGLEFAGPSPIVHQSLAHKGLFMATWHLNAATTWDSTPSVELDVWGALPLSVLQLASSGHHITDFFWWRITLAVRCLHECGLSVDAAGAQGRSQPPASLMSASYFTDVISIMNSIWTVISTEISKIHRCQLTSTTTC